MLRCFLCVTVITAFFSLSAVFGQEIIWSPETLLTTPPYLNTTEPAPEKSTIAVTSDGQVHIVWTSYRPNPQRPQVYYKRYIPGTGWTGDTCISADLAQWHRCSYPAIAADSQNNIHIVWSEDLGYHIWYKMRRSDGTWDTVSTEISVGSGTMPRGGAKVACTPDGHVHVVWTEWYPLYGFWTVYREKAGNVWLTPVTVDSVDTTYTSYHTGLAAGRDGTLHLGILLMRERPPSFPTWVYYRCREGGVWGPRERVSPDSINRLVMAAKVNPITNEPHLLWTEDRVLSPTPYNPIKHTYRHNGVWYEQTVVPADSMYWTCGGGLGFDRTGVGHLIWYKLTQARDTLYTFYQRRAPTGEWGPPELVRSDSVWCYYSDISAGGNSENYNHLYLLRSIGRDWDSLRLGFMHGVPAGQGVVSEGLPGSGGDRPLRILSPGCGEYFLERGCRVHLALYDPAGRLVRELDRGRKPRGRHTFKIPDNLSAGVYFVRLWSDAGQKVGKAILIR